MQLWVVSRFIMWTFDLLQFSWLGCFENVEPQHFLKQRRTILF